MGVALVWAGFVLIMTVMTAVELGVLQRRAHVVRLREAALMTAFWWTLALLFCGATALVYGGEKAMLFLAGYLLEQSLSVDNLFVFLLVFEAFAVAPEHQPRILQWGILGAIVMRFIFIYAGVSLVRASHLMFYVFGGILIWTGARMLTAKQDHHGKPRDNPALRLLHRFLPVTESPHGQSFFTHVAGRWHATPLFAALVVIEATDLVFAMDSIPAALGVTSDLFVVYTSNIFAVMGLRSLYFLLAGSMMEFRYLKTGISAILVLIGAKLMLHGVVDVPVGASLGAVAGVLALSIGASLVPERKKR
jgi:tellurite resistance protein TerC